MFRKGWILVKWWRRGAYVISSSSGSGENILFRRAFHISEYYYFLPLIQVRRVFIYIHPDKLSFISSSQEPLLNTLSSLLLLLLQHHLLILQSEHSLKLFASLGSLLEHPQTSNVLQKQLPALCVCIIKHFMKKYSIRNSCWQGLNF